MDTHSVDQATNKQWYVAYCSPLKEPYVAAMLTNLSVEQYLPLVSRKRVGKKTSLPFFPRYLFLYVDFNTVAIQRINTIPGLIRLIAFGDTPQPIPAPVIASLRQQVDSINAQGGLLAHTFHPGDAVRLKSGPLRGLQAVFEGPMHPTERVQVLLDFLGRLNHVTVDVNQLERAASAAPPQRDRRTRGRGRTTAQTK